MVQSLIAYRNSESEEAQALIAGGLDNVRWGLLSDAVKGPMVWAVMARKMGPHALRMNFNTLLRHDVFESARCADVPSALNETEEQPGRLRTMVDMDPNDSILSIVERLAKYGGGGTDYSLPLVMYRSD